MLLPDSLFPVRPGQWLLPVTNKTCIGLFIVDYF